MSELKTELEIADRQFLIKRLLAEPENLKKFLENLSMTIRAMEGQPVEPDDIYSGLLNIKKLEERTRFQTQPRIITDTYLRLVAAKCPEAAALKDWADQLDEDWIAYQGMNRIEAIEMAKAKGIQQAQGQVIFGMNPQMQTEKSKGRISRLKDRLRGSKEEEEIE